MPEQPGAGRSEPPGGREGAAPLDAFDAFVGEAVDLQLAALDRVETELTVPAGELLRTLAVRHVELVAALETEGEGTAYRRSATDDVLSALAGGLRAQDLGRRMVEIFWEADRATVEMARHLAADPGAGPVDDPPDPGRAAQARPGRLAREFASGSVPGVRAAVLDELAAVWFSALVGLGEAATRWYRTTAHVEAASGLQEILAAHVEATRFTVEQSPGAFAAALADLRGRVCREVREADRDRRPRARGRARRRLRRGDELPVPVLDGPALERLDGAVSRIEAIVTMSDFEIRISALSGALAAELSALSTRLSDPLRTSEEAIRSYLARAGALFASEEGEEPAREELAGQVRSLLADGRLEIGGLEHVLRQIDGQAASGAAADGLISRIREQLSQLPQNMRILARTDPETDALPSKLVGLDLREWASRAFGARRLEGIRDAVGEVARVASSVPELIRDGESVLAYNLEAADRELSAEAAPGDLSVVAELVFGGLERTAEHVGRIAGDLEEAEAAAVASVRESLVRGCEDLRVRLGHEGALRGEVEDALTDIGQRATDARRRLRLTGRTALGRLVAVVRGSRARARVLVRRGQRLAGIETPEEATAARRALRTLGQLDAAAAELPVVYRRLFSLASLADPSIPADREADLEALASALGEWQAGHTRGRILTGPGSGTLSGLLNAFEAAAGGTSDIRRVRLERRILDESVLAATLAAELPLRDPVVPGNLDELAAGLARGLDRPAVVMVEHFEHTFLRTVDGSRLTARALEFFSRTDGLVFWVPSASATGWEIIRRIEPAAARLMEVQAVTLPGRSGLERAMMVRHRRSGIPCQFDAGESPPAGLARRLASEGDEAKRQSMLREAFFHRLFELTDGSRALSLLYWLRSVEFDAATKRMRVALPRALDLAFLDRLTWDEIFTLQALVEHRSLTVEDHAAVFGGTGATSTTVLESLGNLLLIEPLGTVREVGEPLTFSTVETGRPYQVRPVLVPIVLRLLRGRNLVD